MQDHDANEQDQNDWSVKLDCSVGTWGNRIQSHLIATASIFKIVTELCSCVNILFRFAFPNV